jgi:hypothetical protein
MVGIILFLLPIGADMTVLLWTRNAIMAAAVVLTVLSGLDYIVKAYRTRRDSKSEKAQRRQQQSDQAGPGA